FPITTDQSVLPASFGGAPAGGAHFAETPTLDSLTQGQPLPLLGGPPAGGASGGHPADTTPGNHLAHHAPGAIAHPGAVVEAGVHPGNPPFAGVPLVSGNVLANDSDPDTGDTRQVIGVAAGAGAATGHVGATLIGAFGDLVLTADGTWTYLLDNTAA